MKQHKQHELVEFQLHEVTSCYEYLKSLSDEERLSCLDNFCMTCETFGQCHVEVKENENDTTNKCT